MLPFIHPFRLPAPAAILASLLSAHADSIVEGTGPQRKVVSDEIWVSKENASRKDGYVRFFRLTEQNAIELSGLHLRPGMTVEKSPSAERQALVARWETIGFTARVDGARVREKIYNIAILVLPPKGRQWVEGTPTVKTIVFTPEGGAAQSLALADIRELKFRRSDLTAEPVTIVRQDGTKFTGMISPTEHSGESLGLTLGAWHAYSLAREPERFHFPSSEEMTVRLEPPTDRSSTTLGPPPK